MKYVKGKRGESGQPLVEGFLRFAAFLEERFSSPAGDASRDKKEANCRTAMGEGEWVAMRSISSAGNSGREARASFQTSRRDLAPAARRCVFP